MIAMMTMPTSKRTPGNVNAAGTSNLIDQGETVVRNYQSEFPACTYSIKTRQSINSDPLQHKRKIHQRRFLFAFFRDLFFAVCITGT